MAYELRFELILETADGLPRPNARLWLDHSSDYDLDDGEEVRLTSIDRIEWIGVVKLEAIEDADGLFFLLRFVAPEGTGWSLTARIGERLLYSTAEGLIISESRETLTGYLQDPERSAPRPVGFGGRRRRRSNNG